MRLNLDVFIQFSTESRGGGKLGLGWKASGVHGLLIFNPDRTCCLFKQYLQHLIKKLYL